VSRDRVFTPLQFQYALFVRDEGVSYTGQLLKQLDLPIVAVLETIHPPFSDSKPLASVVVDSPTQLDGAMIEIASKVAAFTKVRAVRVTCKKILAWNVVAQGETAQQGDTIAAPPVNVH
jgi:hypothetical protein